MHRLDGSPPARWVGLFPAPNSEGLLLIDLEMDKFSAYVKMSKQLSCDVCLKTFATRSQLFRHKQEHAGVKYNCPKCDKSLSREDNLKTHSLIFPS